MAEFNESEHPRDKDGKFTEKGKSTNVHPIIQKLLSRRKGKGLQFFAEKALENQTVEELESGIKKVQKRKREHEAKIANPQLYCKEWQDRNEYAKAGLIVFWKKEIAHFNQQIRDRESEIEKRGKQ